MTATAAAPPVERASLGRYVELLTGRGDRFRQHGDKIDAQCPAHEDADPSLSAEWKPPDASRSGRVVWHCNTGCSQDAVREAYGVEWAWCYDGPSPDFASRPRSGARPLRTAPRLSPASNGARPVPKPRSGDPGAAPGHVHRTNRREPEGLYVYRRHGERIARVVLWRCLDAECPMIARKGKPGKTWATQSPSGRGQWVPGKPDALDGLLYRADEVAEAIAAGRTIYLCEGEPSAEAVAAAGECGTSAYRGASAPIQPEHVEALTGGDVVVIADRDAKGYAKVSAWAAALDGRARSVRSVHGLADKWPGADVVDHLAAGYELGELADCDPAAELARVELKEAAPESATEPAAPVHRIGRKPRPVEGSPGWQFTPPGDDGSPGAVERLMGSGQDRGMEPVIKSCPRVLKRLVTDADSTAKARRHFAIRWGEDEATVSYADLISGDAWDKFPDALGTGDKPVRAALANVVMTQGAELPRTLAATRTGWHDDGSGGRYYIYADGRTFPDGRKVELIGAPVRLAEAARPRGPATDPEIRQALADIRDHGRFAGLLGLADGARSLGQSIRPVPAALVPHGDPSAGKSLIGWHARSIMLTASGSKVPGWPPLPTKGFSATRTDLEFAANFEADLPALFEDLALPGNASAIEIREANGKLETLIRPLANQDEIRGRRSRDLMPGPANYVRSIPVITAERMPPTMMESLYRRAVVHRLRVGQVDTAWYAENSPGLLTPLRAIGDRVVARLYDLGDDAAGRLGECTTLAYGVLGAAIGNAGWLTSSPAMSGVIDGAAAILGGLYLVADVVPGIDGAELAEPVAIYLAEALAEQAEVMSDRHDDSGSLTEATAHVLTRALATRRAHMCDATGNPSPLVLGMQPSEQGLTDAGYNGWRGEGVALYWLPERGGIGVRSKALAALLAESRDPRAAGLTYRSLPAALLRDGASVRNTTTDGRVSTQLVPSAGARLIILRAEVLTGHEPEAVTLSPARSSESNGYNGYNGYPAGQSVVDDLSAPEDAKNGYPAGQALSTSVPPPASDAAEGAVSRDETEVTVVGVSVTSERFAASAVVIDVGGAYLARADRIEAVELPELADLAAVVAWAKTLRLGLAHGAGMPDDGVVVIMPGLAARLGLPATLPDAGTKAAREHPALGPLRAADLTVPELRSWMRPWRRGERTIRLWLPGWDDAGECPMLADDPPALALAARLGTFADALGIGWRMTGGVTGVDLAGTFPRRRMRLEAADPPRPALVPGVEGDFSWSRQPMTDEAAAGWLHFFDACAMFLPAYGQAVVNLAGWRHADGPVTFDPKLPGYWRLDAPPAWSDRLLPNPFDPSGRDANHGRSGPRWYVTPTLAHAAELGYAIDPADAYLPTGDTGRWYEPWYERVRDARKACPAESTDPDIAAVGAALKYVWHQAHGMLRVKSQREQFRPDHDHVIISTARTGYLRKLIKIGDAERRWPLAIATDNVAYASADPDPIAACPAGLKLGTGLGEFKHKGTLPMAAALPLLGTGKAADVARLFEAAADYLAQHGGNDGA